MTLKRTAFSPLASGNGAHVVHSILANRFPQYELHSLSPRLAAFPHLLRFHRRNADIIHTIPEYGTAFFQANAKNVVTFHNYFWDEAYQTYCSRAQRIYYRLFQFPQVKKAVRAADAVTAVSAFTAGLVRRAFPDIDVKIIPNGVDTERFSPLTKTDKSDISILFSGNVSRRKGAHVLLAVAEKLPDHATLVVTGGLRNDAEELAHPKIRFIKRVPYDQMQELYQECDILLLPSYREGLSLSVLEAMSCGLPVVSYNASSMAELIIHGEGGYLGEPYNPESLSEYLQELTASRDTMRKMGNYNRERVTERFNLSGMIKAYEDLFNQLCES